MKKSLMLSVLGLGLAAAASSAHGQGAIVIQNFQGAYNAVVWDASTGAPIDSQLKRGVHSTDGVTLTLFYGPGIVADSSGFNQNTSMPWNTGQEGFGYFGYYGPKQVNIAGWTSGSTWSFQLVASGASIYGPASGSSVIWQESTNIKDVSGTPPGPAGVSANSIGFTVFVPEPSTFALAGLGTAALMIFRRRKA